jgi:iron complex outermembrane receptor protein
MVEGALYDNALEGGSIRGGNLVGRWDHQLDRGGSIQVQGYVDQVRRISPGVVDYLQSFDVQAQHAFDLGRSQQIVWGAGHHMTRDEFTNSLNFFVLDPTRDTVQLSNLFGQDAIALADDLTLTLGTKFEYSSFSVFEFLPNARLAWAASDSALFWAAVSRSVRTPSRIDRNLVAPGLLLRADDLKSEKLIAYELGYRGMVADRVLLSVSFYYHDYDDLRILINPPGTPFLQFGNAMHGSVFGAEVWADYQVTPWWRLSAGFNALKKDFTLEPTAVLVALDQHQGNDPRYQASLRSYMSLTDDISLYLAVRGVDDLPNPTVPGYVEADARVAWRVAPPLELALTGSNLLHDRHPESGLVATRNEIGRTIFAEMRWSF